MIGRAPVDGYQGSLAAIPAFSELSASDRRRLEERALRLRVPRGAKLVCQGDPADELYLVLSGRFFVTLNGRPGAIAEIGPGEPIGEVAFFGNGVRTANVVAARDSDVLRLTREAYAEIASLAPRIVSDILAYFAKRLAAVAAVAPALEPKPARTVAVLPIGASSLVPPPFIAGMRRAFAGSQAAILTQDDLPSGRGASDTAITAFLNAVEEKFDLVVYAVDRESGFARSALHCADDLMLLAAAEETGSRPIELTPFEREAADLFPNEHRSLVIWRDAAERGIAGSEEWLRHRDVALHHHVALNDDADFARLARFLTGRAVGLVLGGGGAFGCAHLGVAKALREAGVPIDFFGGTSVGAAMAGALAMQRHPDDILKATEEIFVRGRAMRRITIPLYSILDHRRFDMALQQHYGNHAIEDLPVNYFAVSANLTCNDMQLHRRGLLWEAIRASTAIPGILPPFITREGDVLVDGALVDNVPVNVMRGLKLGPNLVVAFRRAEDWRVVGGYGQYPSRAALLRDLLLRRRRRPSLVTVLMRGMFLTSERVQRTSRAGDCFIEPSGAAGFGILDWHRGREIAAGAYRYTSDLLASDASVRGLLNLGGGELAPQAVGD